MQISPATKPYGLCPQFESCSVNRCPLDPGMKGLPALVGDPTCTAKRHTRLKIAKQFPREILSTGGLTEREIVRDRASQRGRELWAALTPAQREARLAVLRTHMRSPRTERPTSTSIPPDNAGRAVGGYTDSPPPPPGPETGSKTQAPLLDP